MSNAAEVVRALGLLRPFDVATPKRRVGAAGDGGYVVLDRPELRGGVLSYGVGADYSFESDLAKDGANVVMFDHTVSAPTDLPNGLRFVPEGLGATADPNQKLGTLESHLATYFDDREPMFLKMDIEGGEYDVFGALNETTLRRFSQISGEFHHMHLLGKPHFRKKFLTAMEKIHKHFFVAHAHSNNGDGYLPTFVEGMPVSATLELTFVRRDLEDALPLRTVFPTALDSPNVGDRDRLMFFYPFCPEEFDSAEFATVAANTVPEGLKSPKYKIVKVPPKPIDAIKSWLQKTR